MASGYGADNVIRYGYLLLNSESGDGANVSQFSALDLSFVVAHELGHVLGLGHSGDRNAVMYFSGNSSRTSIRLASDDVDGISYLYPRQEIGHDSVFGCGTMSAGDLGAGGPPSGGGAVELAILAMICFSVRILWRGKAYDS